MDGNLKTLANSFQVLKLCLKKIAIEHLILYRKIPIISPGLIFVQKAFFDGLIFDYFRPGELTFGGAYCASKWFGVTNNKNSLKHKDNSLKQLQIANPKSPWAYIWEGLLSEEIFATEPVGGLVFGRAYFWRGLLSEFHGILFDQERMILPWFDGILFDIFFIILNEHQDFVYE